MHVILFILWRVVSMQKCALAILLTIAAAAWPYGTVDFEPSRPQRDSIINNGLYKYKYILYIFIYTYLYTYRYI